MSKELAEDITNIVKNKNVSRKELVEQLKTSYNKELIKLKLNMLISNGAILEVNNKLRYMINDSL